MVACRVNGHHRSAETAALLSWVDQFSQQGGRAFSGNAELVFQCLEDEPMSGLSRLDQRTSAWLYTCSSSARRPES